MNSLIVMVGLPCTGKTTFAKKMQREVPNSVYLSSDELRVELFGFEDQKHNSEVFTELNKRCKNALKEGKNVIYDATNLVRKRRIALLKEMSKYYDKSSAIFCLRTIGDIIESNLIRPERQIPTEKIMEMFKICDVPLYCEGFSDIFVHTIDAIPTSKVNKWLYSATTFKQDNPHHKELLGEHLNTVMNKAKDFFTLYYNEEDKKEYFNIIMMAALYHDLGKIFTKQFQESKGYCTFYNHEKVSAYLYLASIVSEERIEGKLYHVTPSVDKVLTLISYHMVWYKGSLEKTIKIINNDNLWKVLFILHLADKWRPNEKS